MPSFYIMCRIPATFLALPTGTHKVQKCAFLIKTVAEMHQNNSKSGKLEHSRWRAGPRVQAGVQGHTHCCCTHAGLVGAALKQGPSARLLPRAWGSPRSPQHRPLPLCFACCVLLNPDVKRTGKELCRLVSLFKQGTSLPAPLCS